MHNVSLEEFLAPISKGLGRETVPESVEKIDVEGLIPPHVTDELSADELVERFAEEAKKVRVDVHYVTPETMGAEIVAIIGESVGDRVIFPNDKRMDTLGILPAIEAAGVASELCRWDASIGHDAAVANAATMDIGITFPIQGIAETGTIVQPCDSHCGRSISQLPATHIAIVKKDAIVPAFLQSIKKIHEAGEQDGSKLPSQVVFITGNSATSDIELVRVEGVHGPVKVHYVLY